MDRADLLGNKLNNVKVGTTFEKLLFYGSENCTMGSQEQSTNNVDKQKMIKISQTRKTTNIEVRLSNEVKEKRTILSEIEFRKEA